MTCDGTQRLTAYTDPTHARSVNDILGGLVKSTTSKRLHGINIARRDISNIRGATCHEDFPEQSGAQNDGYTMYNDHIFGFYDAPSSLNKHCGMTHYQQGKKEVLV